MKYNFCTLFDSNYLSRGLVLYDSINKLNINFNLYVVAFDEECFVQLKKRNYENITIISLFEFEDIELLNVKNTRSKAEYCWTCTSSVILYCLNKYNLENCTYLDADLFFYNTPAAIYEEIGSSSIALSPHNYTPIYDQTKTTGIYCVQFVYFRNDFEGILALKWWRDKCIEWCFARLENGKFGDQKYLDDWPTQFNNVHIIQNLGAGLAPWNIQQYSLINKYQFFEKNDNNSKVYDIIFYHFHYLKYHLIDNSVIVNPSKFKLNESVEQHLYMQYIHNLIFEGEDNSNHPGYVIIFKKNTIFQTILNWLRLKFKKVRILRHLNNLIYKSSR
jgi:hypothetical protein